ncbi:hypothetical protein AB4037_14035 [Labrys sp. KB_33_2]|uniref:hypothetical protein n=1 Tax=Labrys sp. KB_33_2 TaxID=3237479 RepID=UPI003F93E71F
MEIEQNIAWNERDLIAHNKKAAAAIESANEGDWSIDGGNLAKMHYWHSIYQDPPKRPRPSLAKFMQHLWSAPLAEIRLVAVQRQSQKLRVAIPGNPETAEMEMRHFGKLVQELSGADDREALLDELEALVMHAETASIRRLACDTFAQLIGNRDKEEPARQ